MTTMTMRVLMSLSYALLTSSSMSRKAVRTLTVRSNASLSVILRTTLVANVFRNEGIVCSLGSNRSQKYVNLNALWFR